VSGVALQDPRVQRRILLACIGSYWIANVSWFLQPIIVSDVVNSFHVGDARAGMVVAVEMASLAFASMLLTRLPQGFSFLRICMTGAVIAALGNVLSLMVTSSNALIGARLITGCGEGATLMVASAALANFSDPDRAYGKMNTCNMLLGTLINFGLPYLQPLVGSAVAFPACLISIVVAIPVLILMPRALKFEHAPTSKSHASEVASGRSVWSASVVLLGLATFLIATGSGAVWSFYAVIGAGTGLAPDKVDAAIALAVSGGIVGSFGATALGVRFGRFIPVVLGIVTMTIAIVLLTVSVQPTVFRVATCFNVGSLYFLLPYILGYAAEEDRSGRVAAVISGIFLLTGASGPLLGGALMQSGHVESFAFAAVGFSAIGLGCFTFIERRRPRSSYQGTTADGTAQS
jgi:MFS transporter, DHA1 family, inner membrane transport protein